MKCQQNLISCNCSDLRGSGDYSASCGGTTKHGISTANRFRPLKREQSQLVYHTFLLGVADDLVNQGNRVLSEEDSEQ